MQKQPEINPELLAIFDRLAAIGRRQREAARAAGQEIPGGQTTAEGETVNDNLKPIDSKGN
jgi:hypothetical protein